VRQGVQTTDQPRQRCWVRCRFVRHLGRSIAEISHGARAVRARRQHPSDKLGLSHCWSISGLILVCDPLLTTRLHAGEHCHNASCRFGKALNLPPEPAVVDSEMRLQHDSIRSQRSHLLWHNNVEPPLDDVR